MTTIDETVRLMTHSESVQMGDEIQILWSGYGVIQRALLCGAQGVEPVPVVIKHIDISTTRSNRRGWGGGFSHQRKIRSYQVEKTFYENYSRNCTTACAVPKLVAAKEKADASGWIIVLEDVDARGFNLRKEHVDAVDISACLTWLANFHATFLGNNARGLWPVGTYWHLGTRPDEFAAMPEGPLKDSAELIDRKLSQTEFQTLVHGDAKIANFCFSSRSPEQVVAVDFQYVGRGCGMKDVAYFISSCLSEEEAASQQEMLLDYYFEQLDGALGEKRSSIDFSALEAEWRGVYPFAWADFCRFLSGWSPGHWKLNTYSDHNTRIALQRLGVDL